MKAVVINEPGHADVLKIVDRPMPVADAERLCFVPQLTQLKIILNKTAMPE